MGTLLNTILACLDHMHTEINVWQGTKIHISFLNVGVYCHFLLWQLANGKELCAFYLLKTTLHKCLNAFFMPLPLSLVL